MRITVLYFGGLKEIVGRAEESIEVSSDRAHGEGLAERPSPSLPLEVFRHQLAWRYPALSPHLPSVRFAINERFARETDGITEGDIVAVIPPVSGG